MAPGRLYIKGLDMVQGCPGYRDMAPVSLD